MSNGSDFDQKAIQSLREAAESISAALDILKNNKSNYQATNLPVSDAVDHIVSCLIKDSAYLKKLASVCEESAPLTKEFEEWLQKKTKSKKT